MAYFVTIDCGTTNSRAYVVDTQGRIYGTAKKMVGVRDTAMTGSRDTLRSGLREIVAEAIEKAGIDKSQVTAILSSGMITSEIGLMEIPHMMAPGSARQLAESITKVEDAGILDGVPVYFVRGIKNYMEKGIKPATAQVGELDFMRGEETQIMGMLERPDFKLPAAVVVLSSHTKFISVDESGAITGSLTTLSGQLFNAVKDGTFVGKSVEQRESTATVGGDYFDESIVDNAMYWIENGGLVRSLMFPRFLDVLLDTQWYERMLFYDALVAADDMRCISQLKLLGAPLPERYYLIGKPERCRLYDYILKKNYPDVSITSITDDAEIDMLSIIGILKIAKIAGLVK